MPGKLEIQNGSITNDIHISLWSIDGEKKHLDTKKIEKNSSISLIVKGGVKMLNVSQNDLIIWKGVIPSYISSPIIIYPEYKRVVYKDNTIVNMLSNDTNILDIFNTSIVILLIIVILFCIYILI